MSKGIETQVQLKITVLNCFFLCIFWDVYQFTKPHIWNAPTFHFFCFFSHSFLQRVLPLLIRN